MKTTILFAAALAGLALSQAAPIHASPVQAKGPPIYSTSRVLEPRDEVMVGLIAFFDAIRNPDKTALSEVMLPEGMIFIHNRMNPQNTAVTAVPVSDHLSRWGKSTATVDERMIVKSLIVDGDMAHVWGPYRFVTEGETSHCGVNSLSLVKTDNDGWKVANTSFSMVPPSQCSAIGAPEPKEQ
ncbi:hypothetical protein [Erythrobacter sp. F6033]|uniref:hypothetical protein n=1 Tax=Erythrobacter sp. F6033 TaxID=2926401 RepID=UPI001FF4807E|nr:hypothetical protein [Erythrobacter sp. F6033]MCK0127414.1 hypothetical protein [Erythrobacter sp. F6033]